MANIIRLPQFDCTKKKEDMSEMMDSARRQISRCNHRCGDCDCYFYVVFFNFIFHVHITVYIQL